MLILFILLSNGSKERGNGVIKKFRMLVQNQTQIVD